MPTLQELKEEVKEKEAQLNEARGSLKTLMKQLEDEFEVDSVAEGELLLKELENEYETQYAQYTQRLEILHQRYQAHIEPTDARDQSPGEPA